jgi:hypothetical protein
MVLLKASFDQRAICVCNPWVVARLYGYVFHANMARSNPYHVAYVDDKAAWARRYIHPMPVVAEDLEPRRLVRRQDGEALKVGVLAASSCKTSGISDGCRTIVAVCVYKCAAHAAYPMPI